MYSLLYDVIFVTISDLLFLNYSVTLGLLVVMLALAVWRYWNFTRRYAEFPSFSLQSYFIYSFVFRKIPKNLSFTSFVFHKLISVLKEFQNEGVCLMWLYKPILFIFNEEASKIFSNEQMAVDKPSIYRPLQDLYGTGLVTSNGETWKKHRKMLNPVFHVGALKHKLPIFNDYSKILVQTLLEMENKTTVNILEYLKPCTFNILCETIIGFDVKNQENKEMSKKVMHLVDELSELIAIRLANPVLHYKWMLNFLPSGRKYLRLTEDTFYFVKKALLNMNQSVLSSMSTPADSEGEDDVYRKSFARILLEHHAKDPSFTIDDVKSQVITFAAAGYDTVSYGLMWSLFLLGLHPDVQEQAYNEGQSISDKDITYEDLNNLKFLECVIKEALRLYPPVPLHARRIDKDIQCGKYLVPNGTEIVFFPYMLHRDPKIYPDPETFDPLRFFEGTFQKRPWIHTPFSEGLRNCIGKRFAMMEMMIILTHILRNFRVTSLDKREDLDLCFNCVLTPLKPLIMEFSARK